MHKSFTFHTLSKTSRLLKRILILSLFVFICLFLYIMSSIALNQVKKAIEEQYIEDGKNLARTYAITFQNIITQAHLSLDMYANSDVINRGSTQEIAEWFAANSYIRPKNFLNAFYCDSSGELYTDSGKNVNVSDRDYYRAIMSGNYIYHLGSAVYSKTTGKRIIHVSRAVYTSSGELKGFVGGSIELASINKILASAQHANDIQPFILDKDGICISHPDEDALMTTFTPQEDEYKIYATANISKIGTTTFNSINEHGEKVHVFIERIKDCNWTAGVSILDKKIYETYTKLDHAKKVVFLIVIFAGILFYSFTNIMLAALRKKYESTLKRDPLTELLTRQHLEMEATKQLEQNPNANFVLIETDFVGFKFINRNYGEKTGNEALRAFANELKDLCFGYGGIAARGYADHFYYFNQITSLAKFMATFRIAQENIERIATKRKYPFTPKYGISFMTPQKDDDINSGKKSIAQLIGEASMAKQSIKNNNDQAYAVFNTNMAKRILQEQRIEQIMEKALARGEFFVVYQPKINLMTDKVIGAEALVRWNSPELGFLTPDKFIPLFESNGFIKKLDFAVYEMVFKFLRSQLDKKMPVVPISINMSRSHVNTQTFMKEFLKRIEKYDIPKNLIEIEILERSVANEKPILQEITKELHKHGFTVAMDDFGNGESSLTMLNSVPIDVLKFDQNFLKNNADSEKTEQFITSLMKMAQQLQKKTVFEGVETEEQRDFLKSINCDSVQGYFYSKPLMEEDFLKFLKEHS